MFELPKPTLGEVSAITITSPDLNKSLLYYQKLGFSEVMRFDFPFPWIQVSDGALLIMLRLDPKPYCALTYYVPDIDKVVSAVTEAGIEFSQKPKDTDMIKRYLIQTPDGLTISLVSLMEGFVQPPGPTLLTMAQADYFNPDKYPNKVCGIYGELAHPVADLEHAISFWEKLGFKALSKNTAPYPWAIVSDGLAIVGLHQTKTFDYPAITFFAADMKAKIEKLKSEGLTDFAESGSGNIVLTTPEKQHINLFKLGM